MRKPLLLVIAVLISCLLKATHIVGGFLSYALISGTTYEVKLYVYRDCGSTTLFDGQPNPSTGTVTPAYLFIFDNLGNIHDQIELDPPVVTTVNPPIDNPCLTITSNVCVEQGVYTTTYTLPSATQGFTLAYIRCCRNGSITNLLNPGDQGGTYSAYIPPTNTYQNSSPVFNRFPPTFVCQGAPLHFDHSATDLDGDSLVYSLCDPFQGADQVNPVPVSPSGPPFTPVLWGSSYSAINPLGGNSLSIDARTGYLTGTPPMTGQFVVGVCVSEYRNGQLIGTYLRDFQFNVTQCNIPIANIPTASIDPTTGFGNLINCNGLTVQFPNTSYNPPPTGTPLSYFWDFGVQGITNDTSNLSFPTYTFPDTGTYTIMLVAYKGINAQTCSDTTYALLKLYPNFTTDFSTFNICQDSAAEFVDLSSSTSGPVNRWSWTFGDGQSSSSQNPTHNYNTSGTFNVRLISENNKGCKDTMQRTVSIYPVPNSSFTTGVTCVNQPVTFTNTSSGTFNSSLWNFGGGITSSQTDTTITFQSAGSYPVSLIISTQNGCKDTSTQTVVVHPLPAITLNNNILICPFSTAQLSASGGVNYVWSPATGLSNPNIANPVATPTPPNPVTYTVTVTDQFQCVNSDSVTISFHPIPPIDAGEDTSVCLNPGSFRDSVQLHATGGVSYVWTPATGLSSTTVSNPVSRPPTSTLYFVEGTDINGCKLTDSVDVYYLDPALNLIVEDVITICERDTAFINAVNQGASGYSWNPVTYNTHPDSFQTELYPPDTSLYILTVVNYCYTKSDSVLIAVNPLPALSLNPLDSICLFDSIQLFASGAQTYQWDANNTLSATNIPDPMATPSSTTRYYVTGTSALGCVNRDSTLIIVYLPSNIVVSPDTPFICFGNSIQLSAAGAYAYVWQPSSSLSNPNVSNPVATPDSSTLYYVEATNIHGCKTTDSVLVNVQQPVIASAVSPVDACEGTPIQLTSSGGFYYEWKPRTFLNNPFISMPFASPDTNTNYTVYVSNDCFTDSAIVEVIIHTLPFVFAGNDTTIWRDTEITLNGQTNESNHFWNPSTWLSSPLNLNTPAEPQQTQWYELFAIDEYGCLNKDSVLITVVPYTIMDLPTAFSPDGNGYNDIFHIVRWLNIAKLKTFSVYNRWGEKIFETTNLTEGWDGTYKGEKCPLGTYVYMAIAMTHDGQEIVKKGNVTLLR